LAQVQHQQENRYKFQAAKTKFIKKNYQEMYALTEL
jgi:hypothetical protein